MSLGIVPPMTGKSQPRRNRRQPLILIAHRMKAKRGLSLVSGGGAVRLRGPERFGQSEILREMVHADHLVAQLSRALEQSLFFCADDARGERGMRELLGVLAAYRPGFLGRADLGLDRFGADRSFEGGLEAPERFALRGARPALRGHVPAEGGARTARVPRGRPRSTRAVRSPPTAGTCPRRAGRAPR